MKLLQFSFLVYLVLFFVSCKSNEPVCIDIADSNIYGDTVVSMGETLSLYVKSQPGLYYYWYEMPNPDLTYWDRNELSVTVLDSSFAGNYFVHIKGLSDETECVDDTEFVHVTVLPVTTAPCNTTLNFFYYDGGATIQLDSVYHPTTATQYEIRGIGPNGEVKLIFAAKPVNRIYLTSVTESCTYYECYIRTNTPFEEPKTGPYRVYVDVHNGNITVTFCDVLMSNYQKLTGSITYHQ